MASDGVIDGDERDMLTAIASYQFGTDIGDKLFDAIGEVECRRSKTGRVRELYVDDEHVASLSTAGRFTLGIAGGRALHCITDPPNHRVWMDAEAVPFVRDGRNAFAKFVTGVDPQIRPRDEVLIVDGSDALIAIGRAELAPGDMVAFDRGVAVSVRDGTE